MSLMFVFGLIGLSIAGLRGMLIGAALGYVAGLVTHKVVVGNLASVQSQFLESTFTVMGALSKADGAVSRDEIAAAESVFAKLNLSDEQRRSAMAAFSRGKAPGFDLDGEVRRFHAVAGNYRPLLLMFLQIQCAVVAADGVVHPAEHQMLIRVARLLGLSDADVDQLEALLRTDRPSASPQQSMDDAYAALGLTASATDAQIKQTYRRLMSQNHPDKLAGKGLPENMRQMAEERTREISIAYATIKEARGFT
ncbi:co-chaperone DjlA [Povalibacter sp.]|uniref:co-chaperone DjlA n=1 Tax=Povalibacter sp. TaxID=1962978 RepID=UPI002F427A18